MSKGLWNVVIARFDDTESDDPTFMDTLQFTRRSDARGWARVYRQSGQYHYVSNPDKGFTPWHMIYGV